MKSGHPETNLYSTVGTTGFRSRAIIIRRCNKNHPFTSIQPNKTRKTMDYEGQRLAELIFYWIILTFGSVGWIIGYFQQDFTVVFQAWLVGVVLSVVVRTNAEWQKSLESIYHHHMITQHL
jgi:hypothetical protein